LPKKILDAYSHQTLAAVDEEKKAWELVEGLSEPQHSLFLWLLDLCVVVISKSTINKMDAQNMGIVFGPNLLSIPVTDEAFNSKSPTNLTVPRSTERNRSASELILSINQSLSKFMELSIRARQSQVDLDAINRIQEGEEVKIMPLEIKEPQGQEQSTEPEVQSQESGSISRRLFVDVDTFEGELPRLSPTAASLFNVADEEVEQPDSDEEEEVPEEKIPTAPIFLRLTSEEFTKDDGRDTSPFRSPLRDLVVPFSEVDFLLSSLLPSGKSQGVSLEIGKEHNNMVNENESIEECEKDLDTLILKFEQFLASKS